MGGDTPALLGSGMEGGPGACVCVCVNYTMDAIAASLSHGTLCFTLDFYPSYKLTSCCDAQSFLPGGCPGPVFLRHPSDRRLSATPVAEPRQLPPATRTGGLLGVGHKGS